MNEGPVWVAERENTIIGIASVVRKGNSLYVRGMAVHPKARGARIGQLLLARIEEYAVGKGFQRLFL